MIRTKRTSTTKGIRLNDLEYSILLKHLRNYGFRDLRDYLNQTVIQNYLSVAVNRVRQSQKKSVS